MNSSKRKYHNQIEITDLVAEAVSNAAARRNQVLDAEESLSPLSDEQAGSVTGGGILQDLIVLGGDLLGLGTRP
jgi:hypothetical protein